MCRLSHAPVVAVRYIMHSLCIFYFHAVILMHLDIHYAFFIFTLQAGVSCRIYHGCPKCNKHIWEEKDDGNHCPVEGCDGTSRDENVSAMCELLGAL